jgi:hypothetical protein
MTLLQVARYLRINYPIVAKDIKAGLLKAVVMTGDKPCATRYYIAPEWLQDYIDLLNPDLTPQDRSLTFSR